MIDIEQAKTFWPPNRNERWMSKDFESHLVSVIIPTFNRAALLGEAMDSVWHQTYRPIEMIVADDGSTDSTEMAIKQWQRQHHDGGFTLRYLKQNNAGAPVARNLGLIESQGEFIQFLDSDDIIHPEKLEIQTTQLLKKTSLTWTLCGTANFIDQPPENCPLTCYLDIVPLNVYLGRTSWLPHTPLYRRRLAICIGPWMEGLRCWHDWEYGVRALCCDSQPGWNKKTLAYWRVKQDISRISTLAKISKESTESMLQACKQVWRTIPPEWRRDPEYRNAIAKRLLNTGRKQWEINRPASQEMLQWAFRISESPNDRLKIRMMQAGLRVPGPHLTNWLYDSCNKLTRS